MKMKELLLGFSEVGSECMIHWVLTVPDVYEKVKVATFGCPWERRGWSFCLTATFPLHFSGEPENFSVGRKGEREASQRLVSWRLIHILLLSTL